MQGAVPRDKTRVASRARQSCLVAGLGSLVALCWAIAWYMLIPAVVAGLMAMGFLSVAGHRRPWSVGLLAALVGLVVWSAFGTTAGYFRLNQHRLERLVADIQAVPDIVSLELGREGEYFKPGRGTLGQQGGTLHPYDTYRFINGTVVTHYREQAAPDAAPPVLYLDDMLRSLHVPAERYWSLRRSLERLSLGGYGHDPSGQIALYEPPVGGQPWGYGYMFSPDGELSYGHGMQETWKLAPRWFYVLWG